MERNPKPNKFYKDRKTANEASKWDHNDFDRLEKEESNYQKNKYSKNRNNDNYHYRNPQKTDLNSLASDKYQKIYSEKGVDKQMENDDKWKHDKFTENTKENPNNYRKKKEKKPDQGFKRFPQSKNDDRRGPNHTFNNFKQNNHAEMAEEKEATVGNEDKLSNVSTANSDKKNQNHEEDLNNGKKKLDYELQIVSEQGPCSLRLENIANFDEVLDLYFEELGSNDPFRNLLIKIHFMREIMEENRANSAFFQILDQKMNQYLDNYEAICKERGIIDENELGQENESLNKWDEGLQEI